MRLTGPNVARIALPAGKNDHIVFDDDLPGFGVRIREGGKRTWIIQYRKGAKQRRLTLGSVNAIDPVKARKSAENVLAKIQLGGDPQAEKIEAHARAIETLGAVAEDYLTYAEAKLRGRTYKEVKRHLTSPKQWGPLKGLSVHRIQRSNVASRLTEIEKASGSVSANRARASLSALFSWAMRQGLADHNPVVGTNKGEEQSRDRKLTDAELVDVWNNCNDDDYGRIIRLLILTGQRREEVAGIANAEFDLDKALWLIPGERTKNRLEHEVPLSDAAADLLRTAPRREGRALLFGQGKGSYAGWSHAKAALDSRINKGRKAKMRPWRVHDLRRTVATGMAELGVLPHVIEAVLNHVSGHKAGVAGIYNHATYRPEKRQALDRWGAHVEAIVSGKPAANVLPMRPSA